MPFNPNYVQGGKMLQLKPKCVAFSTFFTSDNIVIGIFQGNRGDNPHLDIKVRILFDGEENTPILPPHSYWVVDLMLKCEQYSSVVAAIAKFYLDFYESCSPFSTQDERINYQLKTKDYIIKNYGGIVHQNSLSLEYIAIIIELFCLNEKQTQGAYMFKDLLNQILLYSTNKSNYIELLEASKAGFQ